MVDDSFSSLSQHSLQSLLDHSAMDPNWISMVGLDSQAWQAAMTPAAGSKPCPSQPWASQSVHVSSLLQLESGLASPLSPLTLPPCVLVGLSWTPMVTHLLGCGNGPLRIQHHDSLRDIIFQALFLDSRSMRREQRISGHSKERPGDVFHPIFTNGCPTYFDVSVCSPLNPGIVNRSSITAGSAGLQAEMLKDARHAASVEGVGGVFSPLVVDALGLWTLFAAERLSSKLQPGPRCRMVFLSRRPFTTSSSNYQ